MITLRLEVFSPLTEELFPNHRGTLAACVDIHENATLLELLMQLDNSKYRSLTEMAFDAENEVLTHEALLAVNNMAVGVTPLSSVVLKNSDRICFMACLSEG